MTTTTTNQIRLPRRADALAAWATKTAPELTPQERARIKTHDPDSTRGLRLRNVTLSGDACRALAAAIADPDCDVCSGLGWGVFNLDDRNPRLGDIDRCDMCDVFEHDEQATAAAAAAVAAVAIDGEWGTEQQRGEVQRAALVLTVRCSAARTFHLRPDAPFMLRPYSDVVRGGSR